MTIRTLIITLAATALMASCGASSSHEAGDDSALTDIKVEKRDSAIYLLGRSHAQRMLEHCSNTDMLRNELLDTRARESLIRARISPRAAQAYIQGFRHHIIESGDTLATTLFGVAPAHSTHF